MDLLIILIPKYENVVKRRSIMLALFCSCLLSFILSQPLVASEVGKVDDTSRMLRREEAKKYNYFSFGFTGLSNLGVAASAQSLAFGYLWETTPYASIKATLDSGFRLGDDSASFSTATLGANFFFHQIITPFPWL